MDHAAAGLEVAAGPVHHTSGNIHCLLLCECIFRFGFDLDHPSFSAKSSKSKPFFSIRFFLFFCAIHTKWLPESPRFNILTGQTEKAMTTIANIAKVNNKPVPQGRISIFKQVSSLQKPETQLLVRCLSADGGHFLQQNSHGRFKDLFVSQQWRTTVPLCFIWFVITDFSIV